MPQARSLPPTTTDHDHPRRHVFFRTPHFPSEHTAEVSCKTCAAGCVPDACWVSGLLSTASALEGARHSVLGPLEEVARLPGMRLPGMREGGASEFTAGSLLPSSAESPREIAAGPCQLCLWSEEFLEK